MAGTLPSLGPPCCNPCDDVQVVQVPGGSGSDGTNGVDGAPGQSAFTLFTVDFTIPAELASSAATVGNTSWLAVNQIVYCARVDGSVKGWFKVTAISSLVVCTLQNLKDTANDAYMDNSAPGAILTIGSKMCVGGMQGPEGIVDGSAAGGQLKGTYPDPFIAVANVKGELPIGNGTDLDELSVGSNGTILVSDSTAPLGRIDKAVLPITDAADFTIIDNRVARLNGTTGLPIPMQGSYMGLTDSGALQSHFRIAGADANAKGTDAIDLQASHNAISQVASGTESVIVGGRRNTAAATQSTIVGGDTNSIASAAQESFIGGGASNSIGALGERATIGGGDTNSVTAQEGTIAGGNLNTVSGARGTIAGGDGNIVSAAEGFVGGGDANNCADAVGTIAGGSANATSGGACAIGGGQSNTCTAPYATIPGGSSATADKYGQVAHSSGGFTGAGQAQHSDLLWRISTADATANVEMFLDGATLRATIATALTWAFDIIVVGRSSAGVSAAWRIVGAIQNIAGTTTLTAAVTNALLADGTGATWGAIGNVPVVDALDASDALRIRVTGAAATNIRWVAHGRIVEVSNS